MEFTLIPARTSWRDWDSRCTAWLITGGSVAKARDRSMSDTKTSWRKLIRSIVGGDFNFDLVRACGWT